MSSRCNLKALHPTPLVRQVQIRDVILQERKMAETTCTLKPGMEGLCDSFRLRA